MSAWLYKMKNINETKKISELINTFTFGDKPRGKSLSDAVKFSTLASFWEDIIGKKLAKYTIPSKIKYSKLYISAKNPAVIQEINFNKKKILEKVNSYSKALSITIKDLVLDYKNYSLQTKEEKIIPEEKIDFYNANSLKEIKLDEKYKENIKSAIEKINLFEDKTKNKLIEQIYSAKKAQLKRNNK